jgi:hypothetical protein
MTVRILPEHVTTRFLGVAATTSAPRRLTVGSVIGVAFRGFLIGVGVALVMIAGPTEIGSIVVIGALGLGAALMSWEL